MSATKEDPGHPGGIPTHRDWDQRETVAASVEDWAKFIGLWFPDREPAILDRSALDELISRDFGTPTSHSEFYAAGWAVTSRSWAGGVAMVHTGASCCWRTVLWVAPERRVAYVAASNASDIFEDDHIHDVLESVIGNLINHNPSREIRLVPVTKKDVLTPNLEGMPQHVPIERKTPAAPRALRPLRRRAGVARAPTAARDPPAPRPRGRRAGSRRRLTGPRRRWHIASGGRPARRIERPGRGARAVSRSRA